MENEEVNEESQEMPWYCCNKKEAADINYKAKLEHKLLLGKQDPEPIFDLTDCNLNAVPSGVYSWCKVCRKELLLLQNNKLKSLNGGGQLKDLYLLRVLDLHNNRLSQLPNEIDTMTNLEALYLQFNQLKSLPDTFKGLKNLQVLSLKGNPLKTFPETLCHMPKLSKLDISATLLNRLPPSLCNTHSLTNLIVDGERYIFPPKEISVLGWPEIKEYLCKEFGTEYQPPVREHECQFSLESRTSYKSEMDKWNKAPAMKDLQQQARVESEKSLQALYDSLSKLTVESQHQKHLLYKDVIQHQDRLDEELSTAQHKKNADKQKLLVDLYEVEKHSGEAIQKLLKLNSSRINTEALLEELEKERIEFENCFMTMQNENVVLHRKEVLETMEIALENEYQKYQQNVNEQDRRDMTTKSQLADFDYDQKMFKILNQTDEVQRILIKSLLEEEEYQKKAFAAMMMKKDNEYRALTEQIGVIENELLNLTYLELKKQNLRVESEKTVLEEQRELLTRLLIYLLAQKDDRKREFEKRLDEMETMRQQEQVDFWLLQCQRLMSSKPDQLKQQEKMLDEQVKQVLERAAVPEYISLFASSNISMTELQTMTENDLRKLGIHDIAIQKAILKAVEDSGITVVADRSDVLTPSAPALPTQQQGYLRSHFETECVVCMERECTALFLNCGHVCCCDQCGLSLKNCPLCRAEIEQLLSIPQNRSALSRKTNVL